MLYIGAECSDLLPKLPQDNSRSNRSCKRFSIQEYGAFVGRTWIELHTSCNALLDTNSGSCRSDPFSILETVVYSEEARNLARRECNARAYHPATCSPLEEGHRV